MWRIHKEVVQADRVNSTRGMIGIQKPMLDLNTCSADALQCVSKLTGPTRLAIVKKRKNLPGQRSNSWGEVAATPGIGPKALEHMKVFLSRSSIETRTPAQGDWTTQAVYSG